MNDERAVRTVVDGRVDLHAFADPDQRARVGGRAVRLGKCQHTIPRPFQLGQPFTLPDLEPDDEPAADFASTGLPVVVGFDGFKPRSRKRGGFGHPLAARPGRKQGEGEAGGRCLCGGTPQGSSLVGTATGYARQVQSELIEFLFPADKPTGHCLIGGTLNCAARIHRAHLDSS